VKAEAAEFRQFLLARGLRNPVPTPSASAQKMNTPLLRSIAVPLLFRLLRWSILLATAALVAMPAAAQVRIKDIADVEGIRDNQLVGYGLVVGLSGTGDKLDNSVFTRQSLIGMLERLGVNTRDQEAKLLTKNVAAVMVTANLPAFARSGSRIGVSVSALGDATDLSGGTLLVTPLLAADGEVYAVGQGALATGAISARGAAASVTRGVPTSGRIANGATVEREVGYQLATKTDLRLGLRNPDLTTAQRMAEAVNGALGGGTARATDPRTVALHLAGRDVIAALTRIEELKVEPDSPAVVIIDEASGTIVMGANVRVSTVAIAQGNLTIRVTETPVVSQPGPLSNGTTTTVPRTNIQIDASSDKKLGILTANVTLRDLVASLNALGVGPRDMISILQSIKAAGALQADLEVR
jgi:flagellar P-ring protein FlgI